MITDFEVAFSRDLINNVGCRRLPPHEERRLTLFIGMENAATSCENNSMMMVEVMMMMIPLLSPGRN